MNERERVRKGEREGNWERGRARESERVKGREEREKERGRE